MEEAKKILKYCLETVKSSKYPNATATNLKEGANNYTP